MLELFKTVSSWLTTSGMKIIGILITLIILSQMSKRIKNRFDEKGIQIPFPHRVLFWGDKERRAKS
jgi:hypothetical protein